MTRCFLWRSIRSLRSFRNITKNKTTEKGKHGDGRTENEKIGNVQTKSEGIEDGNQQVLISHAEGSEEAQLSVRRRSAKGGMSENVCLLKNTGQALSSILRIAAVFFKLQELLMSN